jgi:hypothetical protein
MWRKASWVTHFMVAGRRSTRYPLHERVTPRARDLIGLSMLHDLHERATPGEAVDLEVSLDHAPRRERATNRAGEAIGLWLLHRIRERATAGRASVIHSSLVHARSLGLSTLAHAHRTARRTFEEVV